MEYPPLPVEINRDELIISSMVIMLRKSILENPRYHLNQDKNWLLIEWGFFMLNNIEMHIVRLSGS